ncbi:Holliday junction resolvase RuvX [Spongiibacter taiwanensis]|uniref:Holliday junction resolvase RuvX n=1 Tax=Spongiibacter taiwanensis TaxID=1748242 RepID=UPI0020361049|nr:Holliday junction resolvase RuvX [Spongiibacter taiwanensis]USA44795.1 Holliday junction resolvase RuvX [Spongiibacter taiwanensis]
MVKPISVLAFDFGTRWIGAAVGQSLLGSATSLPSLKAKDGIPDWAELEKLIKEWRPDTLVVGLPLNMDGSESDISARARKFGNRLHGRFGLPVEFSDERLSSFEAKGDILEQRHSKAFKQENVDSRSAAIILESWFRQI